MSGHRASDHGTSDPPLASASDLERVMRAELADRGLATQHISDVIDGLIEASLYGVDTHGVRLFPTYLRELDGGRANRSPDFQWHGKSTSARVLDADGAIGPVAGMAAARRAAELAAAHGVGVVAVRNSNYFGRCARYALEIARGDAIGLCLTNSDALVAPIGGRRPLLGTNPIGFAMRGEDEDLFCVDMATSQSSFTQIKHHRERGLPLEPGWAVDPDGHDASESPPGSEIGALLPLGGHKGQCLAMIVEILCCLLTDMPFDHELTHFYDEPFDRPRDTSHVLVAFDLRAFGDPTAIRGRLTRLLNVFRTTEPDGSVVAPGDFERRTEAERRTNGIPLPEDAWAFFGPRLG